MDQGNAWGEQPVSSASGLERYRVCAPIGAGGMATVYLARDLERRGIHGFVALKRLHPHLADDHALIEMFADEAYIASLIQHPNVCGVYDYGTRAGVHYLAMEYVSGETLARIRRELPQVVDPGRHAARVCALMAQVCEGLHAAHELRDLDGRSLDVVHRDVSPENIFLSYDGIAKLIDFGMVKAAYQRHKTQTGMIKGKLPYLQPEVLEGEVPDRRADVWSAGIVAWELLTGTRLFKKESELETLKAVACQDIPPPSSVRPGICAAIDEVVLHALERDVDRRPVTARELGIGLMQAAASARQAAGPAELSRWLDELFPHGRACKEQILTLARGMAPSRASMSYPSSSRSRSRRGAELASETVEVPVERDPFTETVATRVSPYNRAERRFAPGAARRLRQFGGDVHGSLVTLAALTLCATLVAALLAPRSTWLYAGVAASAAAAAAAAQQNAQAETTAILASHAAPMCLREGARGDEVESHADAAPGTLAPSSDAFAGARPSSSRAEEAPRSAPEAPPWPLPALGAMRIQR